MDVFVFLIKLTRRCRKHERNIEGASTFELGKQDPLRTESKEDMS